MSVQNDFQRAALFQKPESIPARLFIGKGQWLNFGEELEKVVLTHPKIWPDYKSGNYKNILEKPWGPKEDPTRDFIDQWGCTWRTTQYGYVGTIVTHPLSNDSDLADFDTPDPETYNGGQFPVDWDEKRQWIEAAHERGEMVHAGLNHGYYLLRLEYLRGFENFMCDLVAPSEDFQKLVDTIQEMNRKAVAKWIQLKPDVVLLREDLGAQDRSIIGPVHFARWGTPHYLELHKMVQEAGLISYFHTDGYIMDLADEILKINPTILNPQDQCNGVESLAEAFKGKICIDLDLDRQRILPFGTPEEVRAMVQEAIELLATPKGGLTLKAEIRSDVPPENLDALASAIETFCGS